jgi:hypothetical protein
MNTKKSTDTFNLRTIINIRIEMILTFSIYKTTQILQDFCPF